MYCLNQQDIISGFNGSQCVNEAVKLAALAKPMSRVLSTNKTKGSDYAQVVIQIAYLAQSKDYKPFYKYKMPPQSSDGYRVGDSLLEHMNEYDNRVEWTRNRLDNALNHCATKLVGAGKKEQHIDILQNNTVPVFDCNGVMLNADKLIIWRTSHARVSWFEINQTLFNNLVKYLNGDTSETVATVRDDTVAKTDQQVNDSIKTYREALDYGSLTEGLPRREEVRQKSRYAAVAEKAGATIPQSQLALDELIRQMLNPNKKITQPYHYYSRLVQLAIAGELVPTDTSTQKPQPILGVAPPSVPPNAVPSRTDLQTVPGWTETVKKINQYEINFNKADALNRTDARIDNQGQVLVYFANRFDLEAAKGTRGQIKAALGVDRVALVVG